ncbi:hypothetical protein HAZT_HAZT002616 [Hyalella azteca]|uniref:Uncharacterized protein n=1 Tax=Hyalella azteca TaxID=294128 RepID=A0A6A0GYR6_HYAAZ|nr:hypothetical protein HAZT_HAZT002616 [Hyalella azteca]
MGWILNNKLNLILACLLNNIVVIHEFFPVPGDGGAQLQARLHKNSSAHFFCYQNSDWFTSWLNLPEMVPGFIDCWTSNMVLEYNNSTRTTNNPAGVDVRVPNFGDTSTVEYLTPCRLYSYFAYIAEVLVALGYQRNVTLRGAPFDFRKAPNELSDYFSSLKLLTEELRESTGGPVVFIAHSMGAPLMNYFLNLQTQNWRKQNVECLVSLAGAWGGSVKAIKAMGFLVLLYLFTTVFDAFSFLIELGLPDAYEMYLDTRTLLNMSHTAPHVALHCLYGVGIPTVERIEFANAKYFPDYPSLVNGPGDGTVNLRSADLCSQYSKLQSEPVVVKSYNETDHMAILSHVDVLRYIAKLVTDIAQRRADARNSTVKNSPPFIVSIENPDHEAKSSHEAEVGGNLRRPLYLGSQSSLSEKPNEPQSESENVATGPNTSKANLKDLVDKAVAKVDSEIKHKWFAAADFKEAYERLLQIHSIQKTIDQKIMYVHKMELEMKRLRDTMMSL